MHIKCKAQPTAFLLAKPMPRNVHLCKVRLSMFNKERDIPSAGARSIRESIRFDIYALPRIRPHILNAGKQELNAVA